MMLLRLPDDYDAFSCAGSACRNSCCVGWELDIDAETADYYRTVEGPFGERLRACIRLDEEPENGEVPADSAGPGCRNRGGCADEIFERKVNGRCPFLNERNLCDIVLELGEEALCDVCAEYPRYTVEFGDALEKTLTLSCEVAAEMLVKRTDPLMFAEYDLPEEYPGEEDRSGTSENPVQAEMIRNLEDLRFELMQTLYRPDLPFEEKLRAALAFAEEPGPAADGLTGPPGGQPDGQPEDGFELRRERIRNLEVLDPAFRDKWESRPKLSLRVDQPLLYENLFLYFWFRYAPRAAEDRDPAGKVKFCLFCLLLIRDLECLERGMSGDAHLSDDAWVRLIGEFSREIEHSEDNLVNLIAFCGTVPLNAFRRMTEESFLSGCREDPGVCGKKGRPDTDGRAAR